LACGVFVIFGKILSMEKKKNNLFEIVAHEIGHLLVDMIIEHKYDVYKLRSFNIFYAPTRDYDELTEFGNPFCGSVCFEDSKIETYEQLIEEGDIAKIQLTKISLLFGSLLQSYYSRDRFGAILDDNAGKSDKCKFEKLFNSVDEIEQGYFSRNYFSDYFSDVLQKLHDEIRILIREIRNEAYEKYFLFYQDSCKEKKLLLIEIKGDRLNELKQNLKEKPSYNELVDLVNNFPEG